MNPSEQHSNWITVGEVINLIKKPVAAYADYIVRRFHAKLCQDCRGFGSCSSSGKCLKKKKPCDLCPSCNGWYKELASSHRNSNKSLIKWRQNCDSSKWPVDEWEVAKFFMSALGDNKSGVLDAESTDLSSLLNVLEWLKDVAFGGDKRVDLNLVKRLRSGVRNAWAHAAKQEMAKAQSNDAFEIANKFLEDLDKVYSDEKVKKCMEQIQYLQANGLTNVIQTDLKNLVLLRKELFSDISQMKEEIKGLNQDQNSDRRVIRENEEKLKNLEDFSEECCSRMDDFQKWKENLDKLFNDVKAELNYFREETRREFGEIRAELQAVKNFGDAERFKPKSRIPEKLPTFIGREQEVNTIKSWLVEKDLGMVTLVGGPGFGKSTIAVEVCHRLSEQHEIPVIFSYLSSASTVAEVVRILCLNVGVQPGEDPESSLMMWLKNIKARIVLVLDNIEQLLEGETKPKFMQLLRSLRMDSGHRLQIITTSRKFFLVAGMPNECCEVETMNPETSVELLKKSCPKKAFQLGDLIKMADLCGHVPLALRLLAFRLQDTDDPTKLVEWLQDTPMEVLQTSDEKVKNAIEKSFEILGSTEKTHFSLLSVLEGNFNREAAQHVTELTEIKTENVLAELVERSLLQRSCGNYSMHLLIRSYLIDLEKFAQDRKRAQELMVEHFLRKCHDLSLLYWSKNGSNAARKALKENLHHVEKVLKIVEEASSETNSNPVIVKILLQSEIYQSSSRFFYNFILYILSPTLVRSFLKCCAKLAKRKKDVAIEVNFQCLLADEIGRRVGWKSNEYKDCMELAKQTFDKIEENQQENSEVKSHFYYCYGRYQFNLKQASADSFLKDSLELRQSENPTDLEVVDQVVTLTLLGKVCQAANKDMEKAACYYKEALAMCKKCLGNHELTLHCYKRLGDAELEKERYEEALQYYNSAEEIREVLGITDSSVASVFFLKNRGWCLFYLGRHEEAVKLLKEACDVIEKRLGENTKCKFHVYNSLAEVLDAMGSGEASEYAKKALDVSGEFYGKQINIIKETMNTIIWKGQGK